MNNSKPTSDTATPAKPTIMRPSPIVIAAGTAIVFSSFVASCAYGAEPQNSDPPVYTGETIEGQFRTCTYITANGPIYISIPSTETCPL